MRVRVSHATRLDYSTEVTDGIMDVRLGPISNAHQRWIRFALTANPNASIARYVDGFGNAAHLVNLRRPHRFLEVISDGEVETLLEDPFAVPDHPLAPLTVAEHVENLAPSALVPRDPGVTAMAEPLRVLAERRPFDAVVESMRLVNTEFAYEQKVTSVSTTVSEVVHNRRGVCQDFAHVLIGLCRALGIPARYVSGYIVTAEHETDATPRGACASHAWVEAFTPSHGWRGFDPTNNLLASTHHVKVASGRDYRDVSPTRGTYRGGAEEHLSVTVSAHPAE